MPSPDGLCAADQGRVRDPEASAALIAFEPAFTRPDLLTSCKIGTAPSTDTRLENQNVSTANAQIKTLSESALALASRGEMADAERVYRQILTIAPYHASSLSFMASQAFTRGQPEEALAHLDKAVEGNPDNALLLINRAHVCVSMDSFEAALRDLDRVLNLRPDMHSALLYKAYAHRGMGDLNTAIKLAVSAMKHLSDSHAWPDQTAETTELPEIFIEAANMIRAAQLALIDAELQPIIENHGKDSVSRIFEGIAVFAGLRIRNPDEATPLRKAVQIAGLTEKATFDDAASKWTVITHQSIRAVREEARELLKQRSLASQALARDRSSAGDTAIAKYTLNLTDEQRAATPAFTALLAKLQPAGPADDASAPALISAPAGQHLLQSSSGENWLLTGYVVLDCTGGVRLSIGGNVVSASPGECIVMNNLADHILQASHADGCVLLSFRLWHPELSVVEIEGLSAVLRALARFRKKYL